MVFIQLSGNALDGHLVFGGLFKRHLQNPVQIALHEPRIGAVRMEAGKFIDLLFDLFVSILAQIGLFGFQLFAVLLDLDVAIGIAAEFFLDLFELLF